MTVAVMTSYTSHPSFSAIHCGLRNIDILQIILYFLDPYPDRNEKTQDTKECSLTLARFARVCRAFKEPATAALWRTLDGLDSILSLLPDTSFCTPVSRYNMDAQYLVLTEARNLNVISSNGWNRLPDSLNT